MTPLDAFLFAAAITFGVLFAFLIATLIFAIIVVVFQ